MVWRRFWESKCAILARGNLGLRVAVETFRGFAKLVCTFEDVALGGDVLQIAGEWVDLLCIQMVQNGETDIC